MLRATSSGYRPLSPTAREAICREVPNITAALARLREGMDEEAGDCACCGLPVRRSFTDAQLAEQIGSMLNKLSRWVGMAAQDSASS